MRQMLRTDIACFRRFSALALLVLSLVSCGIISRNADVKPWIGRPVHELIGSRGQPQRTEPDGKGNKILVYEWTSEYQSETPGRVWRDSGGVHYTTPRVETRVHRERRMFYVNNEGTIFDARWSWW